MVIIWFRGENPDSTLESSPRFVNAPNTFFPSGSDKFVSWREITFQKVVRSSCHLHSTSIDLHPWLNFLNCIASAMFHLSNRLS